MDPKYTTPNEMRERLIARATEDEAFRARLLSDPKAAVHEELGLRIPAGFTVEVHEESEDTSHLVLPPFSNLAEAELGQAAGGYYSGSGRGLGDRARSSDSVWLWDDW